MDKKRTVMAALIAAMIFSSPGHAKDATQMVKSSARSHGVPAPFALKMAKLESGVKCNNNNRRSTASGPLQILSGTARALGYKGNIRKASCSTQTEYGMRHLAMCYKLAKGNEALAKRCHQQGVSAIYGRKKHRKHK